MLVGVPVVIGGSFGRIHRSKLGGMGVIPLEVGGGQGAASLGLTGKETYDVRGLASGLKPGKRVSVRATAPDGTVIEFQAVARVDTPDDVEYYRHGGLLPYVLRGLLSTSAA